MKVDIGIGGGVVLCSSVSDHPPLPSLIVNSYFVEGLGKFYFRVVAQNFMCHLSGSDIDDMACKAYIMLSINLNPCPTLSDFFPLTDTASDQYWRQGQRAEDETREYIYLCTLLPLHVAYNARVDYP